MGVGLGRTDDDTPVRCRRRPADRLADLERLAEHFTEASFTDAEIRPRETALQRIATRQGPPAKEQDE